jgi:AcrR family transcriptional regulator
MTEPELPNSLLAAWGQDVRGGRGPRRALSIEQVLDGGIAVAERDGLDAVSMARVASEIGLSTMALYRYVASKDELLELMVDRALGPPPARPARERSWRAGLTRWADGVRAAYLANPWTLKVAITAAPTGPNNVAWMESALAAMRSTGLTYTEKVSCLLVLSGFVRNDTTLTVDVTAAVVAAGGPPPDYGRILTSLTTPAEFPELHAAAAEGSFSDDDPDGFDGEYTFGLARVLDGIGVLVEKRKAQ